MGSRPTTNDIIRLHAAINGQHKVVKEMERRVCLTSVKAWNELVERHKETSPSTSIGAANTTGYHWLKIWCGGCWQLTYLDLRTVAHRYHPATAITFIASRLVCSRCDRDGPIPTIKGVTDVPPETAQTYHLRKQGERHDGRE